ncbi:MAG: hypothetical protein JKY88_07115 [Pseudomonadales bacterium]|nr:hypothetical protein [Pseudomonadales bacterium]
MTGTIRQMQMLFVPEEDRILFRINSTGKQEYRFWITRRYSLLLLEILRKHADIDPDVSTQINPEAKEAIKNFKSEQAIQGADFKQKFNEDAEEFPLGESIPLAFKLNYKINGDELHLGIHPKEGNGIDIVIGSELNPTLMQLLIHAGKKGDWRLDVIQADILTQDRVIN